MGFWLRVTTYVLVYSIQETKVFRGNSVSLYYIGDFKLIAHEHKFICIRINVTLLLLHHSYYKVKHNNSFNTFTDIAPVNFNAIFEYGELCESI
jgi:hypothetical protein